MNRAQRRKNGIKGKQPTYNLTHDALRAQIEIEANEMLKEKVREAKAEAREEMRDIAFMLMLTIPLEVLVNHYWVKSAPKRMPGFVQKVLDLYSDYENGKVSLDELREHLWRYGGIRLDYKETEVEEDGGE